MRTLATVEQRAAGGLVLWVAAVDGVGIGLLLAGLRWAGLLSW